MDHCHKMLTSRQNVSLYSITSLTPTYYHPIYTPPHPTTHSQPHTSPSTLTFIIYMCSLSAASSPYIQHEHHSVSRDQSQKIFMQLQPQLQLATARIRLRILPRYISKQSKHAVRLPESDCYCYCSPVDYPAHSPEQSG